MVISVDRQPHEESEKQDKKDDSGKLALAMSDDKRLPHFTCRTVREGLDRPFGWRNGGKRRGKGEEDD